MNAAEITRQAKSNLAFALHVLPRDVRDDMVVFYAFCRVIDDIADDECESVTRRKELLAAWRHGVLMGFDEPSAFQLEVMQLITKHDIPRDLMAAIIDGCAMDTEPLRFHSWEDLQGYTWKVACAVGLISVRLFGVSGGVADEYAVNLGHALQLTNIMRDVREDLENGGRIYLPLQDLDLFDYTEQDLQARVYDARFVAMMSMQARRAEALYEKAARCLTQLDHKLLVASEIMREIYSGVLLLMREDQFHVFEKRYRLSKLQKIAIFTRHMIS